MLEENLRIADLHVKGRHRLKESYLRALSEAANVCLERHHKSPQGFCIVESDKECFAVLDWPEPDTLTKATWANDIDATEAGACAVALATVEMTRKLVAVGRAETLTGVDYYLAYREEKPERSTPSFGLEVSGVDAGDETGLKDRLRRKIRQAASGRSKLPAIALVVGFKALKALLADVDGK
jgi:hypothetical protein